MSKIFKSFIALIFIFSFNFSSYSQSFDDLSNVNFSELNDSQIDLLLRRAGSQGYNQFDLLKMARAQGFTQADIENLDKRFKSAQTIARVAESASAPLEETRLRKQWLENIEIFRENDSDVFGYNVFTGTSFLSFQSNLNLPTPSDYILGAGDKMFIDVYGESESYFQAEISPEGYAILENIGPVNLNGLSLEKAKLRLTNRFKKVYPGIQAKKTFLNISVGIPRAIRINIAGEVNLPGTYNFSAFNTLYNALYVAGGITENATLRDIKLFRNNKLISTVDVYKFLTEGDGSSNVRLENNDLILVNTYSNRISIDGAVKSPGKFEMKDEETLLDLLNYAGGLSENAFKKSIKLTRIIDGQLKVVDINSDQFDFFKPMDGDKYMIEKIIEKYEEEISEIDSLQKLKLKRMGEGGSKDFFEMNLSNAETQSLILKRQLENSKEQFAFVKPLVFVQKLSPVPFSDAIIYKPVAVFGFVFFVLGIFVGLIQHFNALLKKAED